MKNSIGLKLTAIMLCIILLGIVMTVGIATAISGNEIIGHSKEVAMHLTAREALVLNEWMIEHKTMARTLVYAISGVYNISDEQKIEIFRTELDSYKNYQEIYMAFPDDTAIFAGTTLEQVLANAPDWRPTEREWYRLALSDVNKTHVTSPYLDTDTGELCITVSQAVVRDGNVIGVIGIDIDAIKLTEHTLSIKIEGGGYAMLVDTNWNILVHPNAQYAPDDRGNFVNLNSIMGELVSDVAVSDGIYRHRDANNVSKYYTSFTMESTGWRLISVEPSSAVTQSVRTVIWIVIPLTLAVMIVSTLIIFLMIKKLISKPLQPLVHFMKKAGETGDISLSSEDVATIGKFAKSKDEIGQTIGSCASFVMHVTNISKLLERIAGRDLTCDVDTLSDKDVLGLSLLRMVSNLNEMFADINVSTNQTASGSKQIAEGAQSLAQGSTEQAASIEELSSAISEIANTIKENAELAGRAAALTDNIKSSAEKSSYQMDEMINAVKDIDKASNDISKIIKVIDDIAFQTNILALNAAVEAARAGQHGKGFAVVAEEVRNLAAKSAEAAKETGTMIQDSMAKAKLGSQIAGETADSLTEIVSGINENATIADEIAKASEQQSQSIVQINTGIDQVAQVIQLNSATAEQSAAASEEMSGQTAVLEQLISQFKIKENTNQFRLPPAY